MTEESPFGNCVPCHDGGAVVKKSLTPDQPRFSVSDMTRRAAYFYSYYYATRSAGRCWSTR